MTIEGQQRYSHIYEHEQQYGEGAGAGGPHTDSKQFNRKEKFIF
jgi:hypothetical protein